MFELVTKMDKRECNFFFLIAAKSECHSKIVNFGSKSKRISKLLFGDNIIYKTNIYLLKIFFLKRSCSKQHLYTYFLE